MASQQKLVYDTTFHYLKPHQRLIFYSHIFKHYKTRRARGKSNIYTASFPVRYPIIGVFIQNERTRSSIHVHVTVRSPTRSLLTWSELSGGQKIIFTLIVIQKETGRCLQRQMHYSMSPRRRAESADVVRRCSSFLMVGSL